MTSVSDICERGPTRSEKSPPTPIFAYVSVGDRLISFALDASTGQLEERGSVVLPSRIRYAWAHPTLPILYAACGNGDAADGDRPYHLCALRRGPSGNFHFLGHPVPLLRRPIHVATDDAGRHILTTYSVPSGVSLHVLTPEGAIGAEILPIDAFDLGSTAHQSRFLPSGARAIVTARGMKGFGTPAYVGGRFNMLALDDHRLRKLYDVSPSDTAGIGGFNPRHLDFHPTLPVFYAILEGQNNLCVFGLEGEDIDPAMLFAADTLADRAALQPRQDAGEVHVHPNGRFVYVANRNDGCVGGHIGPSWLNPDPLPVFPGGENNIAVFAIDPASGAPTRVQNADTRGLHPRAFAIDPTGRFLVAGNYAPTRIESEEGLIDIPASLTLFAIGEDGRLTFLHRHALDVGQEKAWWTGIGT